MDPEFVAWRDKKKRKAVRGQVSKLRKRIRELEGALKEIRDDLPHCPMCKNTQVLAREALEGQGE